MDIKDLLSGSMAKKIGKAVGVDDDVVGKVLKKAVPTLLENMSENSKKKDGAASLQKALLAHADKDDDDDIKKINKEDGAKIIKHILGSSKASVTKDLSKAAGGLDTDKVDDILSMVGPMLMQSVGKKSKANSKKDIGNLLEDVMKDGLDMSDIMKVASKIDEDDVKAAVNVLGKLLKK